MKLQCAVLTISINCSFQAVYLFDQVVEALCNAEVKFIAVERIREYLSIPAEVECFCTFVCKSIVWLFHQKLS